MAPAGGAYGLAAYAYVRENYLGDVHLLRYATLLGTLISKTQHYSIPG